jgi:hypothetical protein
MSPNLRTALLATGVALALLAAGGIGYAIGRSGAEAAAPASPVPIASASPSPGSASPVQAQSPSSGPAVAIDAVGAILRTPAGDDVSPGAATAPCQSLVTPGLTGECGEVQVAGGRVVWVVERRAVAGGAAGFAVRILRYDAAAGGWVERLRAEDLDARRWADVAVLLADLTHDGVAELIVGFHGLGDRRPLDVDVVGYGQDGSPEVVGHLKSAALGSLVVNGAGQLLEYAARYAPGEPACCPGSFELRTITYESGLLRQVATEDIAPTAVPASQL